MPNVECRRQHSLSTATILYFDRTCKSLKRHFNYTEYDKRLQRHRRQVPHGWHVPKFGVDYLWFRHNLRTDYYAFDDYREVRFRPQPWRLNATLYRSFRLCHHLCQRMIMLSVLAVSGLSVFILVWSTLHKIAAMFFTIHWSINTIPVFYGYDENQLQFILRKLYFGDFFTNSRTLCSFTIVMTIEYFVVLTLSMTCVSPPPPIETVTKICLHFR
jgi:hypothetical protein